MQTSAQWAMVNVKKRIDIYERCIDIQEIAFISVENKLKLLTFLALSVNFHYLGGRG